MKKNSQPPPPPEVRFRDLACGRVTVLPTESMERLETIIEELNSQYHPTAPPEQFLIAQAVEARWNGERYRRLLNHAYAQIVSSGDPDSAILQTLQTPNNILVKLERSIAACDRAFSRAVRELAHHRAATAKSVKQAKQKAAEEWFHAELSKVQSRLPRPTPIDYPYPHYAPEPFDFEPPETSSSPEKAETKLPDPHPGERSFCGGM